jgi:hypothetical protein
MIVFRFGKIGKVHISRPTNLELVAFTLVLCFFLVLFLLWR